MNRRSFFNALALTALSMQIGLRLPKFGPTPVAPVIGMNYDDTCGSITRAKFSDEVIIGVKPNTPVWIEIIGPQPPSSDDH